MQVFNHTSKSPSRYWFPLCFHRELLIRLRKIFPYRSVLLWAKKRVWCSRTSNGKLLGNGLFCGKIFFSVLWHCCLKADIDEWECSSSDGLRCSTNKVMFNVRLHVRLVSMLSFLMFLRVFVLVRVKLWGF